jgi:hypothetical protein
MTYSCTDFTDDVLRCLVEVDAIEPQAIPADDPGAQADLAVEGILSLHRGAAASRLSGTSGADGGEPERAVRVRIHGVQTSVHTYDAITVVIADLHLHADLVSDQQIGLAKSLAESHGASFEVSEDLKLRVEVALRQSTGKAGPACGPAH